MKTFKDLEFKNAGNGAKQAVMRFPNGYGVSVLWGKGSLSDKGHPFEIATILFDDNGEFVVVYPDFCDNDVLSFKTKDDVDIYMGLIQEMLPAAQ